MTSHQSSYESPNIKQKLKPALSLNNDRYGQAWTNRPIFWQNLQFFSTNKGRFVPHYYQLKLFSAVDEARATPQPLATEVLDAFTTRYQHLLDRGFQAKPPPPIKHRRKSGGRLKQSPARNLLDRLQTHQTSVLGFMHDFDIPFDNNQAERDIRMVKLKQKISGTFRSESGARMFCRLRGYISTLRKQGLNVLAAFISLFSGHPQAPISPTE